MSLHQIIYTSCMRGINGVNDGQQIFSYDATFKDANNDEVKSLFSYQPPALEIGMIMTEELARTMPQAFTYRKLDNGTCTLALNTYLGRDYMGSAGRFGNHLSHVVLMDESDIQTYPCEFYGSSLLRNHMEFEEVNNPNKPDFLPEPILEKGYSIDIDAVIEFLAVENRMDVYKNMLCAVLSFESERKRVVICDEPENIIMWIAAIEYALPLKMALGINFSTYDFDPSLSASQICGVVSNGTRYTAESQRWHFVFDMKQNNCIEFEKDEHYYDFIDTALSFSYDSLQDFHRFVMKGYNYDKADEKMYAMYRLYSLLSDGIFGLTDGELKSALDFAAEYAIPEEQHRIIQSVLEQRDYLLQVDTKTFLCVMRYLLLKYNLLSMEECGAVKRIVVDRVLYEFLNNTSGENTFVLFYNEINAMCTASGFGVATELMKEHNSKKLFTVMQNDIATWKIAFIIKVVSTYIKEKHVPVNDLLIETPLGQTYYGFLQAVYSQNAQNGFYLVKCILDEFSDNCEYLINMALNVEGMLWDIPGGNQEVEAMWKYFGQAMLQYHNNDFNIAYSVFSSYQRYEQIYMLYAIKMEKANNLAESQQIFSEHYRTFVNCDIDYSRQYGEQVLNNFYLQLNRDESEASYQAKVELFNNLVATKRDISFAESLVKDVIKNIPFESPSREHAKLIRGAYEYLYNNLHKPIAGKLFLLIIGMAFDKCISINQLQDALENLERLAVDGKANMSRMTERTAEKYFEWLLPKVCKLCKRSCDLERVYNLFEMPRDIASLFFTFCAKHYLKQSKGDKDYDLFCDFLQFVFAMGNTQICEDIGKVLCKLSKQKLADLDEMVNDIYRKDKHALRYWDEIKKVADSTNPLLNNFSNIFKRIKD